MGRGGNQQQVQDSGNALLKTENQNATQNQQEGQNAYGFLMPAYSSMYSKPGYTDAQKAPSPMRPKAGPVRRSERPARKRPTRRRAPTTRRRCLPAWIA